ncbi:sensor domain-containing diguanylate cyclase [Brevibacillus nitrificans]|nr:diguanylate cyclase [Brevibacillus nitrificans]
MQILHATYNPWIVILSVLISNLAFYTALDLMFREGKTLGRTRKGWLFGGAIALGTGLWSMFFTSMVAFHVSLPVNYDWRWAFASLPVVVIMCYLALFAVNKGEASIFRFLVSSIIIGLGLIFMHIASVSSLIIPARIHYSSYFIVSFAILIGCLGHYVALHLIFHMERLSLFLRKMTGSLCAGVTLTGAHYLAMTEIEFTPNVFGNMGLVYSDWISHSLIGIISVMISLMIGATIGFSHMDKQVAMQAQRLTELRYHSLFYNNPDAVFTLNMEGKIMTVNPSGYILVGFSEKDLLLKSFFSFIEPSDIEKAQFHFRETAQGEGQEYVIRCIHKEGNLIHSLVKSIPMMFAGKMIGMYAIVKDITAEKLKEEKLQKSEEQYRIIADNSSDLIKVFTVDGEVIYASPSHGSYLGHSPEMLLKEAIYYGIHPEDESEFRRIIGLMLERKASCTVELRRSHLRGDWIWIEAKGTPVVDEEGEIARIVLTERDIRERKAYEDQLRCMAYFDSLTQIPNRRMLQERFTQAVDHANRLEEGIAVMYLDCDRFKMINDTLGHECGDEVLKEIVKRIKRCISKTDTIARLGGDEFVVLLRHITSQEYVREVAEKIYNECSKPMLHQDQEINMAISMGIARYPEDGNNYKTLLKRADEALYEAKRLGRNNFQLWSKKTRVHQIFLDKI